MNFGHNIKTALAKAILVRKGFINVLTELSSATSILLVIVCAAVYKFTAAS